VKEIKAYIRQHRIADVLDALRGSGLCDFGEGAGCHNITVSQVQHPYADAEPAQQHYSMDLAEPVVAEFKLELVCSDGSADALVDLIAKAAHTEKPEAGWIFVSDVLRAVEIR
jgi:nitrogen regulatory protein PII